MRSMAKQVASGVTTSIEMCPSFAEVMRYPDMRVEAFSLMLVRVMPSSIVMSKAEVKHIIETIAGEELGEEELAMLPGTEGPSPFEDIFKDEVEVEVEGSAE